MAEESTLQGTRTIDLEEFFADPVFSGPSISPDGTRIAYLAPHLGRTNGWVRGIDEDHSDAVAVTHDSRRGITTFQWTGDPRWMTYMQDTDGNEDWHLFRVDLENPGEPAVDLTPMDPGSRVFGSEPLKSDPGALLVWMNRDPMSIDLFRLELATGETTPLVQQPEPTGNYLVDEEGRPAFHTMTTADGDVQFSAVDAGTGERRLLRTLGGAAYPMGVAVQRVTPDGTGLVLGEYGDSDDLRLIRVDRETGEETVLAAVEGHDLDMIGTIAPTLPPSVFEAWFVSAAHDDAAIDRIVGALPAAAKAAAAARA